MNIKNITFLCFSICACKKQIKNMTNTNDSFRDPEFQKHINKEINNLHHKQTQINKNKICKSQITNLNCFKNLFIYNKYICDKLYKLSLSMVSQIREGIEYNLIHSWKTYKEKHETLSQQYLFINEVQIIKTTKLMKIIGSILAAGSIVTTSKIITEIFYKYTYNVKMHSQILPYIKILIFLEISVPLSWWFVDPYLLKTKSKILKIAKLYDRSVGCLPLLNNMGSLTEHLDKYLPIPFCCKYGEKLCSFLFTITDFIFKNRLIKTLTKPISNYIICECRKIKNQKKNINIHLI